MARFEKGDMILEFWFDGWPEGFYHDESNIEIEDEDGNIVLDKDQEYDLYDFGVIVSLDDNDISFLFVDVFNNWFNKQDTYMCGKCKEILGFVRDGKLEVGDVRIVKGVFECRLCGQSQEWIDSKG